MSYDPVFVLGLDGLTLDLLEKYNCKNILQKNNGMHGKTDISEFEIAQSNILWPSFIETKNKQKQLLKFLYWFRPDLEAILEKINEMENSQPDWKCRLLKDIFTPGNIPYLQKVTLPIPPSLGGFIDSHSYGTGAGRILSRYSEYAQYMNRVILDYTVDESDTFLKHFYPRKHIDFPALSYKTRPHKDAGRDIGRVISRDASESKIKEYNKSMWKLHFQNEIELSHSLDKGYKGIFYYDFLADGIGHVNFGRPWIMRKVYEELDGLVEKLHDDAVVWVVSDHEMEQVFVGNNNELIPTRLGTHLDMKTGFWSVNRKTYELKDRYSEINYRSALATLQDLENGKPKLTELGHAISLYGNRFPE